MKNKYSLLFLALGLLFMTSASAQKNKDKNAVKKVYVLPVRLNYSGLPSDTVLERYVQEAFTRHKVKLIGIAALDKMIVEEEQRIAGKYRAGNNSFQSERELREAISRDQRFVANVVSIEFITDAPVPDSLQVTGAKWSVTPVPVDISVRKTSGEKITLLENMCCSPRDNIYAIVDKILYSKWLQ